MSVQCLGTNTIIANRWNRELSSEKVSPKRAPAMRESAADTCANG